MKPREKVLLAVVLGVIACTAATLIHFRSNQRLGEPGIRSTPTEGALRRAIELPQAVPGYIVSNRPTDQIVVDALPADTSFGQALYADLAGRMIQVNVVMMGTDRTSIHKPQFCLTGQGWVIDEARSAPEVVSLSRPQPVDLPVMKLVASRTVEVNGTKSSLSGIYVYWFVADKACTASHSERMWWMARHLVQTGELQRWAYVSYFMPCRPGQEETAFEAIKKLIRVTVPEFQTAWPAPVQPALH